MVTDKQRREVAARIRELTSECLILPLFMVIVQAINDCLPEEEGAYALILADLIDRPECSMECKMAKQGRQVIDSEERDTRILYRLGTDHYCEFEDSDEYVRMGDLVEVCEDTYDGDSLIFSGNIDGIKYDNDGFISGITLFNPFESFDFDIACDGVFYHATDVEKHDD